jgi:hypothetical protein
VKRNDRIGGTILRSEGWRRGIEDFGGGRRTARTRRVRRFYIRRLDTRAGARVRGDVAENANLTGREGFDECFVRRTLERGVEWGRD